MKKLSLLGLAAALMAGCGGDDDGNGGRGPSLNAIGVTTEGRLVAFDTRRPGTILNDVPIVGVAAGQTIVGIDQRPANGEVYAVSNTGVVYNLNPNTGTATAVGPDDVVVDAAATGSDIDFNPAVDLIRLGNASDQNIRVNPNTGAQVDGDQTAGGVQGDANFAYEDASPAEVVGLAYDNSNAGALTTTLYGIDRAQDRLVVLNSTTSSPAGPNGGRLVTVGALGLDVVDYAPFDIASDDSAAIAAVGDGDRTRIVRIDLATGAATRLERTPVGVKLVAFALADPVPTP